MENAIRIIITVFFIGLIAMAIIFFGVFGLVPLGQIGKEGGRKEDPMIIDIEKEFGDSSSNDGITSGNVPSSPQLSGVDGDEEASENDTVPNIPSQPEENTPIQQEPEQPTIPPPPK